MELVAFDTETTGAYPLQAELCELAAVKFRDGQVVDQFQTLVKPSHLMSDFIIGIHGITNEMVATAPRVGEVLSKFRDFAGDAIMVAHHAPFDMGFLAFEFEKHSIPFPGGKVLCSSLLARAVVSGTPNHKLQTLIQHFRIDAGIAHRALSDAIGCLGVTQKCFEILAVEDSLTMAFQKMGGPLDWPHFSIQDLKKKEATRILVECILEKRECEIQYDGKTGDPKTWRRVYAEGIVRGPKADYFVVKDFMGGHFKRFFLSRLVSSRPVGS